MVATVLTVWKLRDDLAAPWRWVLPMFFTGALLLAGQFARARAKETLAAATFLAGAALAIAPATLALLAELRLFAAAPAGVTQLFPDMFTNQQVLAASLDGVGGFRVRLLAVENDRLRVDHGDAGGDELREPAAAVQLAGAGAGNQGAVVSAAGRVGIRRARA